MISDSIALLQLMQTKGVGPRSLARVLDQLERDNLGAKDLVSLDQREMIERFGLKEDQVRAIRANKDAATRTAELLENHDIRTLLRNSSLYPPRLRSTLKSKTPPVLFVAGSAELLRQRGVGFCGARDASEEALRCTAQVARALADHGLLVVSGHAQGVDEFAHRAALEVGGRTALVLPEGILHFRPRPSLVDSLTEDRFVIISEFPPSLPWSVSNAMQRNRTICGLVHALIVIEAGTSGGTWEAGQAALELGIPLFVLEFTNPAPTGKGNPLLLKKGGQPLPVRPGDPPDLSLLVRALDLTRPQVKPDQMSLFDQLGTDV